MECIRLEAEVDIDIGDVVPLGRIKTLSILEQLGDHPFGLWWDVKSVEVVSPILTWQNTFLLHRVSFRRRGTRKCRFRDEVTAHHTDRPVRQRLKKITIRSGELPSLRYDDQYSLACHARVDDISLLCRISDWLRSPQAVEIRQSAEEQHVQTAPGELDRWVLVHSPVEQTLVLCLGEAFFEGSVNNIRRLGQRRTALVWLGVHDVVPVQKQNRVVVSKLKPAN